jgi:glucose/arabinose dehydrogenase
MRVGPDRKLYITVGAPCNGCKPEGDEYGIIIRINPDKRRDRLTALRFKPLIGLVV